MKKSFSIIAAALVFSLFTSSAVADAGLCRTFTQSSIGPGYPSLNSDSTYKDYQWGFLNTGIFQLVRTQRAFPVNNSFVGQIYDQKNYTKVPNGPGNYEKTTIPAIAGIDINLYPAWELYDQATDKRSVVVAVIDTGVDSQHSNLQGSMWVNEDEIAGDGIDNDGNGYIDDINGWNFYSGNSQIFSGTEDSHGTHGAGTIAATRNGSGISGIADNQYVKLMSLKALGTERGVGSVTSIIQAIQYAEANGASICNLSFGTTKYSEELYQVMQNSKMLFVVAAGNGNGFGQGYDIDSSPVYPAAFDSDNIISVANLMFDGNLSRDSNFGVQSVDVAAPGSYILSTTAGGGYSYMSGTSMAAPMVTGIAAMIYSYHTDWSLAQVREAIIDTSRPLDSLQGKTVSQGMADASAALAYTPTP